MPACLIILIGGIDIVSFMFCFIHHVYLHLSVQFEEPRDIVGDNGDEPEPETKPAEVELSEEVYGTQEYGEEDGSTIQEAETEYEDEEVESEEGVEGVADEEEENHPGELSIGKKIFKFFTT